MASLLEVENTRMRFNTKGFLKAFFDHDKTPYIDAVCGVSLKIETGETLALVGESGSGKTTLGLSIIGLLKPFEGNIRFQGKEISGLSDTAFKKYRRNIAMMFQDPVGCLSPRLTIKSLLKQPFKIHSVRDRDLNEEVKRLLNMVGLPTHFEGRYPHQLSGGQARRVGVARACALGPSLIIADEPTAGLDVSVQGEVLNLMKQLQSDHQVSYLVITHNLSVVKHISHRIAVMYLGRFVEQGETKEVFHHPRHPYTHALLSANPKPDPDAPKDAIELKGDIPSVMNRPKGCEFHTRCPFAKDRCFVEAPSVTVISPGHTISCHYPLERDL